MGGGDLFAWLLGHCLGSSLTCLLLPFFLLLQSQVAIDQGVNLQGTSTSIIPTCVEARLAPSSPTHKTGEAGQEAKELH